MGSPYPWDRTGTPSHTSLQHRRWRCGFTALLWVRGCPHPLAVPQPPFVLGLVWVLAPGLQSTAVSHLPLVPSPPEDRSQEKQDVSNRCPQTASGVPGARTPLHPNPAAFQDTGNQVGWGPGARLCPHPHSPMRCGSFQLKFPFWVLPYLSTALGPSSPRWDKCLGLKGTSKGPLWAAVSPFPGIRLHPHRVWGHRLPGARGPA